MATDQQIAAAEAAATDPRRIHQLLRVNRALVALALLACGGILLGITAAPGRSQFQPAPAGPATATAKAKPQKVQVVNTGAEPVPVSGTVSANVSGTVSAQQSGTWNVGLAGTPSVLLANPTNNPALVRDLSHAARQPFIHEEVLQLTGGVAFQFHALPQVPAGKRLVIESMTASADLPTGQQVFLRIDTDSTVEPGVLVRHYFPLGRFDASTGMAASTTKLYAQPGTVPELEAQRTGGTTGTIGIIVALDGYLEDAG